jgi:hypothetical protein
MAIKAILVCRVIVEGLYWMMSMANKMRDLYVIPIMRIALPCVVKAASAFAVEDTFLAAHLPNPTTRRSFVNKFIANSVLAYEHAMSVGCSNVNTRSNYTYMYCTQQAAFL